MFARGIEYKTAEQVRLMRQAGLVVAEVLAAVREHARPGVTTAELDTVAAAVIGAAGAVPSFLGYHGYPATICVSVNEEVVHGIPGDRRLRDGDVVSVDAGAIVKGWHGDSAVTFILGDADPADAALVEATRRAMWAGVAALSTGRRVGDVGRTVEESITASAAADGTPYGIVEDYTGHGIGSAMHQMPDVVNFDARDRGPRLRRGMCLAVEPMVTRGTSEVTELDDGWTAVTADGSRAAHWEHTVAITPGGVWVLTAEDGGEDELRARGVTVTPVE